MWAMSKTERPIVSTNFRPYEAAILHATSRAKKDIQVIWCDTGYNTPNTYKHADEREETLLERDKRPCACKGHGGVERGGTRRV